MSKILKINNLQTNTFDDFNLEIEHGSWTSIIGPSGSGKTTLVKVIAGIYKFNGEITIDGNTLNDKNKKVIYQNIGILFENPDNLFFSETVYDEIAFSLINMGMAKKEIKVVVENTAADFGITEILKRNPRELSNSEKQIVALAAAIIKKPKLLIIDEGFNRLSDSLKNNINKYLKKMDITLIYLSSLPSSTLYSDRIIIIKDSKIVNDGGVEILKDDKAFINAGLCQPFMISLSNKLSYYELVDEPILDMKEMVNKIWK